MKTLLRILAVSVLLAFSGCYTRYILTDETPVPVPYSSIYGGYYDAYWVGHPAYFYPHRVVVRVPIVVHKEQRQPYPQGGQGHARGYRNSDPPKYQQPPPPSRNSGATRSK